MSVKKSRDAKLFYAHAGLFAFSEIIFVLSLPILFLNQGFSLSFIFAFYGFAALPGYFLTIRTISHIVKGNIQQVLILGVVLYIAFGCTALFISEKNLWWLAALVLLAFQALLYWPARHLYFVEIAQVKTIGLQTGVLNAVVVIARTVAPFVSGLVAIFWDFRFVLIFGAIFMLLSAVPIMLIRKKVRSHFDLRKFREMKKTHPVFTTTRSAYVADGMNSILSYLLWPLLFFLFLAHKNYFELGSLMTVTYGISALIMLVVGHYFDQEHRKTLLGVSVFSNILGSCGRFILLFFHPVTFVYGVQSLATFSESALQSIFEAYWYSYSKATNTAFFTIHREINFALGRFLICMLLAGVSALIAEAESLWLLFLLSIPVVSVYWRKRKVDSYLQDSQKPRGQKV